MRPYLRAANVKWAGLDLADVKQMNFTPAEVSVYELRAGDLLLNEASGSPKEVGKPAIWRGEYDGPVCFQNTLLRVRPGERVVSDFLRLRFLHEALSGGFAKASRGVGIHHLGAAKLAALEIELPSLDEQRRIVDLLEDHLSRLDAADRNLQDGLQRAEAWRRVSLERAVAETGGSEVRLGDLAASVKNGIFVSRAPREPDGVPILRIGSVRSLQLDLSDVRFSRRSESDLLGEDMLLLVGDLLFTRYNGNPRFVGACAVVPPDIGPLTYPDKLIRVRVDRLLVLPEFVAMACTAGQGRQQIQRSVKTTSGQAGISGQDLRRVTVRVPGLAAQQTAVARVQQVSADADRLTATIGMAQQRSVALRRALLEAAFTGRLTGRSTDTHVDEVLSEAAS